MGKINMKNKHKQTVLSGGIIFLLLVPLLSPVNSGHTLKTTEDKSTINNIIFNSNKPDQHLFPQGYSFEKNIFKKNVSSDEIKTSIVQQKNIQKCSSITRIRETCEKTYNPMNSSWPMYCHDTKHTGQSPYNTTGNSLTEKWRFPMSEGSFYLGFIIDAYSIIYGGSSYIYALYSNGSMKWAFPTYAIIESTPAIDENGIIYIGTIWGMPNYLHAIYSNNGTQKWKYSVGSNDITSSPAIGSDGTIYFGDWAGYVHAVYLNGTRKWAYHTGDVITSSPAIGDDGTIYIGSHDDYVYAFYPNGTVKWRFQTGSWVHASPTIGSDGTIYIGSDDSHLYALNPENGSMVWRCHVPGGTWCSPAIGSDGTLYLGTFDMVFCAINPNGTIKWTYNAPGRIWFGSSASISSDGTIFLGTTTMDGGSGALIALNPDGTERFKDTQGVYPTSPAIAEDGTVYAYGGSLHAFGSGEPKKIEITEPEPGHLYLLGIKIGSLPKEKIVVCGSVKVKVNVYSVNEFQRVDFAVDGTVQFSDTTPPYEWRMNKRYSERFLWGHTITATAYYKGGCQWSESIDVLYFHLMKSI